MLNLVVDKTCKFTISNKISYYRISKSIIPHLIHQKQITEEMKVFVDLVPFLVEVM